MGLNTYSKHIPQRRDFLKISVSQTAFTMDLRETVLGVADLEGISPIRLVGIAVAVAVSSFPILDCIKA